MNSNVALFCAILLSITHTPWAVAQFANREEFEIAMTNILSSEYIPFWQLTNTLHDVKSLSESAESEMLRHEAAFMHIWIGTTCYGFTKEEEQELKKPYWGMAATNALALESTATLPWMSCVEMAEYVASCVEDQKYQEGFDFGTNALARFAAANVQTNSIIWPFIRKGYGDDDYPPMIFLHVATGMAAKKMGNLQTASNLVSQLHSVDLQLFWLDDDCVVEVDEDTETVTVVERIPRHD